MQSAFSTERLVFFTQLLQQLVSVADHKAFRKQYPLAFQGSDAITAINSMPESFLCLSPEETIKLCQTLLRNRFFIKARPLQGFSLTEVPPAKDIIKENFNEKEYYQFTCVMFLNSNTDPSQSQHLQQSLQDHNQRQGESGSLLSSGVNYSALLNLANNARDDRLGGGFGDTDHNEGSHEPSRDPSQSRVQTIVQSRRASISNSIINPPRHMGELLDDNINQEDDVSVNSPTSPTASRHRAGIGAGGGGGGHGISTEEIPPYATLQGILEKRRSKTFQMMMFQQRFFRLDIKARLLSYFTSIDSPFPLGFVLLADITQITKGNKKGRFDISTNERVFSLRAENDELCRMWINGLNAARRDLYNQAGWFKKRPDLPQITNPPTPVPSTFQYARFLDITPPNQNPNSSTDFSRKAAGRVDDKRVQASSGNNKDTNNSNNTSQNNLVAERRPSVSVAGPPSVSTSSRGGLFQKSANYMSKVQEQERRLNLDKKNTEQRTKRADAKSAANSASGASSGNATPHTADQPLSSTPEDPDDQDFGSTNTTTNVSVVSGNTPTNETSLDPLPESNQLQTVLDGDDTVTIPQSTASTTTTTATVTTATPTEPQKPDLSPFLKQAASSLPAGRINLNSQFILMPGRRDFRCNQLDLSILRVQFYQVAFSLTPLNQHNYMSLLLERFGTDDDILRYLYDILLNPNDNPEELSDLAFLRYSFLDKDKYQLHKLQYSQYTQQHNGLYTAEADKAKQSAVVEHFLLRPYQGRFENAFNTAPDGTVLVSHSSSLKHAREQAYRAQQAQMVIQHHKDKEATKKLLVQQQKAKEKVERQATENVDPHWSNSSGGASINGPNNQSIDSANNNMIKDNSTASKILPSSPTKLSTKLAYQGTAIDRFNLDPVTLTTQGSMKGEPRPSGAGTGTGTAGVPGAAGMESISTDIVHQSNSVDFLQRFAKNLATIPYLSRPNDPLPTDPDFMAKFCQLPTISPNNPVPAIIPPMDPNFSENPYQYFHRKTLSNEQIEKDKIARAANHVAGQRDITAIMLPILTHIQRHYSPLEIQRSVTASTPPLNEQHFLYQPNRHELRLPRLPPASDSATSGALRVASDDIEMNTLVSLEDDSIILPTNLPPTNHQSSSQPLDVGPQFNPDGTPISPSTQAARLRLDVLLTAPFRTKGGPRTVRHGHRRSTSDILDEMLDKFVDTQTNELYAAPDFHYHHIFPDGTPAYRSSFPSPPRFAYNCGNLPPGTSPHVYAQGAAMAKLPNLDESPTMSHHSGGFGGHGLSFNQHTPTHSRRPLASHRRSGSDYGTQTQVLSRPPVLSTLHPNHHHHSAVSFTQSPQSFQQSTGTTISAPLSSLGGALPTVYIPSKSGGGDKNLALSRSNISIGGPNGYTFVKHHNNNNSNDDDPKPKFAEFIESEPMFDQDLNINSFVTPLQFHNTTLQKYRILYETNCQSLTAFKTIPLRKRLNIWLFSAAFPETIYSNFPSLGLKLGLPFIWIWFQSLLHSSESHNHSGLIDDRPDLIEQRFTRHQLNANTFQTETKHHIATNKHHTQPLRQDGMLSHTTIVSLIHTIFIGKHQDKNQVQHQQLYSPHNASDNVVSTFISVQHTNGNLVGTERNLGPGVPGPLNLILAYQFIDWLVLNNYARDVQSAIDIAKSLYHYRVISPYSSSNINGASGVSAVSAFHSSHSQHYLSIQSQSGSSSYINTFQYDRSLWCIRTVDQLFGLLPLWQQYQVFAQHQAKIIHMQKMARLTSMDSSLIDPSSLLSFSKQRNTLANNRLHANNSFRDQGSFRGNDDDETTVSGFTPSFRSGGSGSQSSQPMLPLNLQQSAFPTVFATWDGGELNDEKSLESELKSLQLEKVRSSWLNATSISALLGYVTDDHWRHRWSSTCRACSKAAQNFLYLICYYCSEYCCSAPTKNLLHNSVGDLIKIYNYIPFPILRDQALVHSLITLLSQPVGTILYHTQDNCTDSFQFISRPIPNPALFRSLFLKLYSADLPIRSRVLYNMVFMLNLHWSSLSSQPGWSDWVLALLDDIAPFVSALRARPWELYHHPTNRYARLLGSTLPLGMVQAGEVFYLHIFQLALVLIARTLGDLYTSANHQERLFPLFHNLVLPICNIDQQMYPFDFNPQVNLANVQAFSHCFDYASAQVAITSQIDAHQHHFFAQQVEGNPHYEDYIRRTQVQYQDALEDAKAMAFGPLSSIYHRAQLACTMNQTPDQISQQGHSIDAVKIAINSASVQWTRVADHQNSHVIPATLFPWYENKFNLPLAAIGISSALRPNCYRSQLKDVLLSALSRSAPNDYLLPRQILDTQLSMLLTRANDRKNHKMHQRLPQTLYLLMLIKSFVFSLPLRLEPLDIGDCEALQTHAQVNNFITNIGNGNAIKYAHVAEAHSLPGNTSSMVTPAAMASRGSLSTEAVAQFSKDGGPNVSHKENIYSLQNQLSIPSSAFALGRFENGALTKEQFTAIPAMFEYYEGRGLVWECGTAVGVQSLYDDKSINSRSYDDYWINVHWRESFGLDNDIELLERALRLIQIHKFVEPEPNSGDQSLTRSLSAITRQSLQEHDEKDSKSKKNDDDDNKDQGNSGLLLTEPNSVWDFLVQLETETIRPTQYELHQIKQIQRLAVFFKDSITFLLLVRSQLLFLTPKQIHLIISQFVKGTSVKQLLIHKFE